MPTLFTVLHLVVAVLLIVVVLGQEGKDPGMKGISGSSPAGDSFFSQNGGSTKKSVMTKITVALSVLFLITTMVLVLIAG